MAKLNDPGAEFKISSLRSNLGPSGLAYQAIVSKKRTFFAKTQKLIHKSKVAVVLVINLRIESNFFVFNAHEYLYFAGFCYNYPQSMQKNPVLINAGPTVGEGGCRPFRRSRSHLEEGNPAIRDGRGLEHVFLMLSDVCFTHINNSCIGSVCCLILDISYAERSYGTHQSPINCNLNTNFFF